MSKLQLLPIFRCSSVLLLCLIALGSSALQGSEIRHQQFQSGTLQRDYVFNIYLPDGYGDSGLEYPVLYLLHGNRGTENSWVDGGDIQGTADKLISTGKIPPMLIVIPADPHYWWTDGPQGKALSAFVEDLIPHIDNNFRTIEQRAGRIIGGYSAGGFGSVNLALRYPELFAAAAPLSPAVYSPVPPASSSAMQVAAFMRDGEFSEAEFTARNWVSFFDDYKASGVIVPFYINTGDHDRFDIAYHAAVFYQALREYQPELVELRIFDGDHDFAAWGGTVGNAMEYMARFVADPR